MTKQEAAQELFYWQFGDGSNYLSMLFTLRGKADLVNKARLELAYPVEMEIYQEWYDAASPEEFYREYDLDGR